MFNKLLEIFQKVSRYFLKSCLKGAQKTIKSCFLYTLRTESPSIFLDKSAYLGKIEVTLLTGYFL